jgi:hypothetical protein
MNILELSELKNIALDVFKKTINDNFNDFKNKNFKDLLLYKENFKNSFIKLYYEDYKHLIYHISKGHSYLIKENILIIFKNNYEEIEEAFETFRQKYGPKYIRLKIIENIKLAISYIIEQYLYNFSISDYLDELINKYIEELLEKAHKIDSEFNIYDIKEVLDNIDYLNVEDLLKIILNNKLSNKLDKKLKIKKIKI